MSQSGGPYQYDMPVGYAPYGINPPHLGPNSPKGLPTQNPGEKPGGTNTGPIGPSKPGGNSNNMPTWNTSQYRPDFGYNQNWTPDTGGLTQDQYRGILTGVGNNTEAGQAQFGQEWGQYLNSIRNQSLNFLAPQGFINQFGALDNPGGPYANKDLGHDSSWQNGQHSLAGAQMHDSKAKYRGWLESLDRNDNAILGEGYRGDPNNPNDPLQQVRDWLRQVATKGMEFGVGSNEAGVANSGQYFDRWRNRRRGDAWQQLAGTFDVQGLPEGVKEQILQLGAEMYNPGLNQVRGAGVGQAGSYGYSNQRQY
jgi:hypothetical protein